MKSHLMSLVQFCLHSYNIYIYICISYIPGTSALPDNYACMAARGRAAPEGECVYIGQGTRAWDITNMLHFLHSAS